MKRLLAVLFGGVLFGAGLALSGMVKQEVVLSFLQLEDLGLILVMAAAVVVTMFTYKLLSKLLRRPLLGGTFDTYTQKTTKNTVLGAVIFGWGWGLSGLCPGSAFASLGVGNFPVVVGIAAMFVGAYAQGIIAR